MIDWARYYLSCKFPIIPIGSGSKCPVVRGWNSSSHRAEEFGNRNIGVRAGEMVEVDGKRGYLLIIDFDLDDIALFRELCAEIPLPRTTCVRTGGSHNGYHLYYLTEFEVRKRGMLSYRHAMIDLLGRGSFAVVPPSVVDRPYRYLIGLEELSFLNAASYEILLQTLSQWKEVNAAVKRVRAGKLTPIKGEEALQKLGATAAMRDYFSSSLQSYD